MRHGYAPHAPIVYGNIALVLKEGLRGARYLVKSARHGCVRLFHAMPSAIRRPILGLVAQFDTIAERVDRRTSNAAHHYLDPAIARDSDTATFSKIIARQDASVLFAKITYDNLKLIIAYLSPTMEIEEKFFISEMLSACAYRKAAARFDSLERDSDKAGLLAAHLLVQGVVRTPASTNAAKSANSDIGRLARVSSFANMLWLVVARDYVPEREEHLLYACCDLALVIAEQIEGAGQDDAQLGALLQSHAEII